MNIDYYLIDKNFTKATNRKIEYIVIHYTAGVSSKPGRAKGTATWFNNPSAKASAHYIVDDGGIVQAVSDNDIAWHCGAKSYTHAFCRNANSIGIEICSNHDNFINYDKTPASDPGWYFTNESKENAAKLTANLMKKYKIPITNVLMHYNVTGKDCPAIFVDENKEGAAGWRAFLQMVKNNLTEENEKVYVTFNDIPEWGKEAVQYFTCKGYINGTSNGELNLNYDMVRLIVIMYRILKDKGVL